MKRMKRIILVIAMLAASAAFSIIFRWHYILAIVIGSIMGLMILAGIITALKIFGGDKIERTNNR
jgi:hypothetical protein